MADNFCTQCGERLRPQARFCPKCGAAAAAFPGRPDALHGSRISMPSLAIPSLKDIVSGILPDEGSSEEQISPYGLMDRDLDYLVAGSFANALFDTSYLLVRNSSGLAQWTPVTLIQSMQGLTVLSHSIVNYVLGDEDAYYPFFLLAALTDRLPADVADAVNDAALTKATVCISISLQYKPPEYSWLDRNITRTWISTADEKGPLDVRTVLQMPFSGYVLKQRLLAWAARLRTLLEESGHNASAGEKEEAIRAIEHELRSLMDRIPDGFANHILCVSRVMELGKEQPTERSDPREDTKRAVLHPDSSRRILNVLSGRDTGPFKRQPVKSSGIRPLESPLVRGFGLGSDRSATARAKRYIRSDL